MQMKNLLIQLAYLLSLSFPCSVLPNAKYVVLPLQTFKYNLAIWFQGILVSYTRPRRNPTVLEYRYYVLE